MSRKPSSTQARLLVAWEALQDLRPFLCHQVRLHLEVLEAHLGATIFIVVQLIYNLYIYIYIYLLYTTMITKVVFQCISYYSYAYSYVVVS